MKIVQNCVGFMTDGRNEHSSATKKGNRDEVALICGGRLFHTRAAATGNAWLPKLPADSAAPAASLCRQSVDPLPLPVMLCFHQCLFVCLLGGLLKSYCTQLISQTLVNQGRNFRFWWKSRSHYVGVIIGSGLRIDGDKSSSHWICFSQHFLVCLTVTVLWDYSYTAMSLIVDGG